MYSFTSLKARRRAEEGLQIGNEEEEDEEDEEEEGEDVHPVGIISSIDQLNVKAKRTA